MADYNPPSENLPIFDASVFVFSDTALTQGDADKRYLRYPNAQGTENLAQINVNGAATFNTIATLNGTTTINGNLNQNGVFTVNNYSIMKKNLTFNSTTALDRNINCTYYGILDKTTNTSTGNIYGDGSNFFYDNDMNGKAHYFINNTAGGVQTTTLQMDTNNFIINTVNPPTLPLATMPAYSDSSNKVPSTAWVQGAISAGAGVSNTYTVNYTTVGSTSYNTPANCRFIDVCIVSRGGDCGTFNTTFNTYGGSGSGGNMATAYGLMIGQSQTLTINIDNTSTTGYYELRFGGATICKVYNGNNGTNSTGGTAAGAFYNSTPTITDNTIASWIVAFGRAGSDGSTTQPSTGNASGPSAMTPRNIYIWNTLGSNGLGQRTSANPTPTGVISITYHTA